ncbi:ATP-dependent DNA helicase [Trueperella pecoris]|uniref:ATP-dependent DNA helicase n=1 Tax=Trueperella pecoris TaxID=2733571 RepID=UPI00186B8961|nr:ATP-dependent DNA helicase [Trueperella pecoris]QOQ38507.1 ATP-dependent helicase [Trueperella pecoris]
MISYEDFARTLDFPPTPEQEAVIRSEDHAIAVIAGAGSGKTATMSQRIAWHVVNGNVRPDEVLGLTFTTKATGELAERVDKQLRAAVNAGLLAREEVMPGADGDGVADSIHGELARPTISTYNSFASEIASSYSMLIGQDPRSRLITDAERWQIMDKIVRGIDLTDPRFEALKEESPHSITRNALHLADQMIGNTVDPTALRAYLEREIGAILQLQGPRAKGATDASREIQTKHLGKMAPALKVRIALSYVVEDYLAYKQENSLIEFADQVVRASQILATVPKVAQDLCQRYKLILLDEYQDTSSSQAELIEYAFSHAWSVCAVGDPNQAIYSWRGASSAALGDFMDRFGVGDNLTLSTAFRNSERILDVANALTQGKLSYPSMTVKKLQPKPRAEEGRVVHVHRTFREDSYAGLASYFAEAFERARSERCAGTAPGQKMSAYPTAAILCRARDYMEPAIKALEEAGVPYEVVGGEALIEKPEIRLVRALLGLGVNPERNDLVVPLLTFYAIGAKDIVALHAYARELARQASTGGSQGEGSQDVPANLVEALMMLPATPVGLSEEAHRRLRHLGTIVKKVIASRHLSVPEAITTAIGLLGLEAQAKSRLQGGARVQAALASFVGLGAKFASDLPGATLASFVEWVNLLEEHENVGEGDAGADLSLFDDSSIEPESGVVQLLTIHAAKGLEWDLVGIPDMKAGGFDEDTTEVMWQESKSSLPYVFRQDSAYLPDFVFADRLAGCDAIDGEDKVAILTEVYDYLAGAFKSHHVAESRRLAYVAVTRPRASLILASYDLVDESKAAKARTDLVKELNLRADVVPYEQAEMTRNAFIEDVTHLVTSSPVNDAVLTGSDLDRYVAQAEENIAQLGDAVFDPETKQWPVDVDRRADTVDEVRNLTTLDHAALIDQWRHGTQVVLSERNAYPQQPGLARDYLTASDVVALAQNAQNFLVEQRRPIPHRPSRAARTGVLVHEAIAHHFDSPATLDVDAVAFPGQMPIDMDVHLTEARRAQLLARFETSRFAHCPPLAIEEAIDVRVGPYPVRCVIDAVLDTSLIEGLPQVTIVDWKTGRRPGAEQVASRQFQLGLYRLAWSRSAGIDLGEIGACFYYLGEDDPELRELHAGDMTGDEIAEQIRRQIAEGQRQGSVASFV